MAEEPETLNVGVLHGPNLNLLGRREPGLYGRSTLGEVNDALTRRSRELACGLEHVQSNHEGALIDWIQERGPEVDGFVVNAGGLTHTSVALRDALLAVDRPFVEVHLSNVFARESFRGVSLLADAAVGVVSGLGATGYRLALEGLIEYLRSRPPGGARELPTLRELRGDDG